MSTETAENCLVSYIVTKTVNGTSVSTGPPTHIVGVQTNDAVGRLSVSSSVVVCRLLSSVTLYGGPVEFRPVMATLCFVIAALREYLAHNAPESQMPLSVLIFYNQKQLFSDNDFTLIRYLTFQTGVAKHQMTEFVTQVLHGITLKAATVQER